MATSGSPSKKSEHRLPEFLVFGNLSRNFIIDLADKAHNDIPGVQPYSLQRAFGVGDIQWALFVRWVRIFPWKCCTNRTPLVWIFAG